MKTVGSYLKQARLAQKISLNKLSEETKIKKEFIEAIEKQKWGKLPEFAVVSGFVKNIAGNLKLNRETASAMLRRDYPPSGQKVNPKPDVKTGFRWNPRLTFLLGIAGVFVVIGSYLGLTYYRFSQPPEIEVATPFEGEQIFRRELEVRGKTNPNAIVRVADQPVNVDEEGSFSRVIEVNENTEMIIIKAISRSGKEVVVERTIEVILDD